MPVILQVNYIPSEQQQALPVDARLESAHRIAELPGFRWKVWIRSADPVRRGGIYLFDDLPSALGWGREVEQRLSAGGGRDIEIRYFDVDPEPSRITQAPLGENP
ncbi:MAG: YdhR family protein [Burkholderiaceae bacterium]